MEGIIGEAPEFKSKRGPKHTSLKGKALDKLIEFKQRPVRVQFRK